MSVCETVETSFRKLLEKHQYGKITVSMICNDAGIARKTFYSHFANKEAIISMIFERDIILPQTSMRNLLPGEMRSRNVSLFTSRLYEAILDDSEFYYTLVGPLRGRDDTFLRVATNAIYDFARCIVESAENCQSDEEADYAAYFFASSQAMLMQKWISEHYVVPPEDLASWYEKFTMGYWHSQFPEFSK